ncbi:MAG: response regulator [Bacteroidota bacterium]|nr:response regulator [Bacteroidota bacterium]
MTNGLAFSILVVDDDEDDRMVIDEAFLEIGYDAEVKKFIDGKALLHYLESISADLYPSLIVLDNTLPQLDATDLLSILKSNSAYNQIPVVIYTTSLSPSKKEQLSAKGAYACFEKGSTMQEIVQLVKDLRNIAEEGSHNPAIGT